MMTDQEALLETIFNNPDKDTPRLVYADWLEEHDEAECAGFYSCRLSRFDSKKR